mgnify:CR=1 FL=1
MLVLKHQFSNILNSDDYLLYRCESPSISWLCDELVRRLSRRRLTSSQASSNGSTGVPDSQQIILTRASDGAELFPEDTITDLLNDNEKVSFLLQFFILEIENGTQLLSEQALEVMKICGFASALAIATEFVRVIFVNLFLFPRHHISHQRVFFM